MNRNNARSEAGKKTHPPTTQPKHREYKFECVPDCAEQFVNITKHKVSSYVKKFVYRFTFLQFDKVLKFQVCCCTKQQNKQANKIQCAATRRIALSQCAPAT